MAPVHVPDVLINLCALCREHILDRVDYNSWGLLTLENQLDLFRKGMADWLVLNPAMVTAEPKGGHAQGKIGILFTTLSPKMEGATVTACIVHGPQ